MVQGTMRPDRDWGNSPEFGRREEYPPPAHLEGIALLTWQHYEPLLRGAGVLTDADLLAFEKYCHWAEVFELAQKNIRENGVTIPTVTGDMKKNPAVTAAKDASAELRALSGVLGLDPAARTRINVPKKDKPKAGFGSLRGK